MLTAQGQQDVTVSGSVQSDMLLSTQNEENKQNESGDFMTNTYVDVMLQSQHIDATSKAGGCLISGSRASSTR